MALKDYNDQFKTKDQSKYIASGVKSPNSNSELLVVVPLEAHPQLKGFYKAIDPTDDWQGWVEHTPGKPVEPTPTPETKKQEFFRLTYEYKKVKDIFDLGVFTEQELGLDTRKAELKTLFKPEYLENI